VHFQSPREMQCVQPFINAWDLFSEAEWNLWLFFYKFVSWLCVVFSLFGEREISHLFFGILSQFDQGSKHLLTLDTPSLFCHQKESQWTEREIERLNLFNFNSSILFLYYFCIFSRMQKWLVFSPSWPTLLRMEPFWLSSQRNLHYFFPVFWVE